MPGNLAHFKKTPLFEMMRISALKVGDGFKRTHLPCPSSNQFQAVDSLDSPSIFKVLDIRFTQCRRDPEAPMDYLMLSYADSSNRQHHAFFNSFNLISESNTKTFGFPWVLKSK